MAGPMEWALVLALLACPVGMGLMMWVMMRGGNGRSASGTARPPGDRAPGEQAELVRLQAELDQLQAAERDQGRRPTT